MSSWSQAFDNNIAETRFNNVRWTYSRLSPLTVNISYIDADYADDIALLANTPTQAKSLLHNLE